LVKKQGFNNKKHDISIDKHYLIENVLNETCFIVCLKKTHL